MPVSADYRPAPVHDALGPALFDVVAPATFPQHVLRIRNQRQAATVGLAALTDAEWVDHFARFTPLPGNLHQPLALRYHGHQFRAYNPHLGDGRGFLFAQLRDGAGRLLDLGTKGSGQTPWSRGGDGRLTLKGGVREVLATAMLEALGVYTSSSFSLIETGESLWRGDEPSPTRASVLVRLSHSHVRFGTFQRLYATGDVATLRRLVEHVVAHYLPEAQAATDPVPAFLRAVTVRSARLAAQWMCAGFVHGVLNTDNMNVTGESFDYGPWRFLPALDLDFTAAYFDHGGLYAYGRQPATVRWNLERLAETLTPLAETTDLRRALSAYEPAFQDALASGFCARLGVVPRNADDDARLVDALVAFLQESPVGFERCLFDWFGGETAAPRALAGPAAAHYAGERFAALRRHLAAYAPARPDLTTDPYFAGSGPCTMLIDEVEALWAAIAQRDDWGPLQAKLDDVERLRARLGFDAAAAPGATASPPRA